MRIEKRISLALAGLLILSMVVMFAQRAEATDRGDRQDVDVDVDVTTGGTNVDVGGSTLNGGDMIGGDTNVSTGGNKTFAFAYGMGDVDINEGQNCYGSEQWGTVIVGRQTMELNAWCAALFYELNGRHERAAALRCTIKDIKNTHPYYGDEMACIEGETLMPDEPMVTGEAPAEIPVEDYIGEQIQMAVDDEISSAHEQVEYRMAQQQNLIDSVQQENRQLKREIASVNTLAGDYIASKQRAQAILNEEEE